MRSIHSIHPTIRKIILGVFFAALCCLGGFAFARAQGMGDPVIIRGDIEIFTVMDDWAGGESGVELAVQQWGSLLGHSIKIHSVGAGCEFGITPEDIDRFVRQNNPLIIIGPSCSHTAFDIAKPLSDRKVLTISPSATDANLTGSSYLLHPFFFRTAPNDINEGRIGARWANEVLKAPSAGIFYMDPDPEIFPELFHQTPLRLRDQFKENFSGSLKENSIIAIPEPLPFEDSFQLFEDGLVQMEQNEKNLGLVVNYAYHENVNFDEGGMVALQHVLQGRIPVLSSEGLIHGAGLLYFYIFEIFHESPPKDLYATGTYFSGGPLYKNFQAAFRSLTGEDPTRFNRYASLAYDATHLALLALSRVAVPDDKGNLVVSRAALLNALTDSRNYIPPVKGAAAVYHAPQDGDFNPEGYAVFKAIEREASPEEANFLLVWTP